MTLETIFHTRKLFYEVFSKDLERFLIMLLVNLLN
jgi:hypothetical protein